MSSSLTTKTNNLLINNITIFVEMLIMRLCEITKIPHVVRVYRAFHGREWVDLVKKHAPIPTPPRGMAWFLLQTKHMTHSDVIKYLWPYATNNGSTNGVIISTSVRYEYDGEFIKFQPGWGVASEYHEQFTEFITDPEIIQYFKQHPSYKMQRFGTEYFFPAVPASGDSLEDALLDFNGLACTTVLHDYTVEQFT